MRPHVAPSREDNSRVVNDVYHLNNLLSFASLVDIRVFKMSADNNASGMIAVCTCCGIAENNNIKLKECDDCDLVRYCSVNCQRDHISRHLLACKKRAAELRDKLLFKQPESSNMGDCPICSIPLPLDVTQSVRMGCCSKIICNGCNHANEIREIEMRLQHVCPFCREPVPKTDEENEKYQLKRIQANDPVAICHKGIEQYNKGDYHAAFEYFKKATALGDVDARTRLAILYGDGSVIEKDRGKAIYHLEIAAIAGHPMARYILGGCEWSNGNDERAVKHWMIAAAQGGDDSIKKLLTKFREGCVSKEDLAAALRAHQAAVNATKSPERDAAAIWKKVEASWNDDDC